MGISKQVRDLIGYVANNDLVKAKESAKAVLAADKTEGNAGYRKHMMNRLDTQVVDTASLVPNDLKGLLFVEDSAGFMPERYLLMEREAALFDKIKRSVRTCAKLGEMRIRYPNVILLTGESGVGKTEFGRFVGHELDMPFAYLNFSQAIDSYLGATSRNISRVFNFVHGNPCVLMLDEIDTVAGLRENGGQAAEKELARVTVTIMQELDRLPNEAVVIAATNLPKMIDSALMRRFRIVHEVRRPTAPEALAVACCFLAGVGVEYDEAEIAEWMHSTGLDSCVQAKIIESLIELIAQMVDRGEGRLRL